MHTDLDVSFETTFSARHVIALGAGVFKVCVHVQIELGLFSACEKKLHRNSNSNKWQQVERE